MRHWGRITAGMAIAVLAALCVVATALAAVGNVTNLVANPATSESIVLTWTPASGSASTVIRYRTDTYPNAYSDGTSAYSGSGYQCEVGDLTAGTTYYFSAWGYDGASYSGSPAKVAMNTLAVDIPTGSAGTPSPIIPIPTLPESALQEPDISGLRFEPFTSIFAYFNNSEGGLGMPIANAYETLVTFGIVAAGLVVYIKQRSFFVAYFVVMGMTVVAILLDLNQGMLLGIEVVIGLGVWAVERYFQ
jgi:hypothetical protein